MTPSNFASLSNQRVIVTGGASGIGAAMVQTFARNGAKVGILDIDASAAQTLCNLVAQTGEAPLVHCHDLTDLAGIDEAMRTLVEGLGGVDVLVNNAARDDRHTLDDLTPDYWRNCMATNLDHMIFATRAVLQSMRAVGGGAIINMGSCSWRLGLIGMPAYLTAKAAVEGMTNALARELGSDKIRVNCVVPGFVSTPRQNSLWLTPELRTTILASQSLPDLIEPNDVAELVAFLASDSARMCTSGSYTVDAGWI